MQQLRIPEIMNCGLCGTTGTVLDWDYDGRYQVRCTNNHGLHGRPLTVNRAIHRWNQIQRKITAVNTSRVLNT